MSLKDLQAKIEEGNLTYKVPVDGWVCFHCGERFTKIGSARDHFGHTPQAKPACVIKLCADLCLVMELRKAEKRANDAEEELKELKEKYGILPRITTGPPETKE